MPKLDTPAQLAPVFQPKIWGRRSLAPLYARSDAAGSGPELICASMPKSEPPIGEVWLTDDSGRFLNGVLAGMTLGEASRLYGPELHGRAWPGKKFPVLAKYLFTNEWLSVQVHPDDAYVRRRRLGDLGKCEMWYIIRASRRAAYLLGAKPKVTADKLKAACEAGTSKRLLKQFRPKAGEAVFVPPGTVHALGPGLVLFEAEQNSDPTFRLDDFGRPGLDGKPRPLHLKEGLEVSRLDLPARRNLPHVVLREPFGLRRFVVASPYFAVEELTVGRIAAFHGSPDRVEVLSVLAGEGRVETGAGWLAYRTGETWLIPPATEHYRLVPRLRSRFLKFYVPDLDRDFRQPLKARSVRDSKIQKIVFD